MNRDVKSFKMFIMVTTVTSCKSDIELCKKASRDSAFNKVSHTGQKHVFHLFYNFTSSGAFFIMLSLVLYAL